MRIPGYTKRRIPRWALALIGIGTSSLGVAEPAVGAIVYSALQGNTWDLWQIDPRTKVQSPVLQTTDRDERSPAWSPDATRIAFSASDGAIWLVDADGSNGRKIATGDGHCDHPTWSPDGLSLTYAVSKIETGEVSDLWQTGVEKSDPPTRLFQGNRVSYFPAWSPTKEILAFSHFRKDAQQVVTNEVVLWDKRNTSFHSLTLTRSDNIEAAWSSDGASIAFTSNLMGNYDIWTLGVHRGALIRVTDSPAYDGHPTWEPGGTRLGFVSSRSGTRQLWIADADGTNPHQLTHGPESSEDPDWAQGAPQ